MRRVFTISCMLILAVSAGGGVWAAERISSKPCLAAIPADAASLQPIEEYPLAAGRIVALDARTGRVTITHRRIGRFYIDPGTSVFHVQDRAMLTGLTPGDRVRFDVERDGRRYDITRLENSN